MPDALKTPLDVHNRLIEIAQKAVRQVQANPRPQDAVLPDQTTLPTSAIPTQTR